MLLVTPVRELVVELVRGQVGELVRVRVLVLAMELAAVLDSVRVPVLVRELVLESVEVGDLVSDREFVAREYKS